MSSKAEKRRGKRSQRQNRFYATSGVVTDSRPRPADTITQAPPPPPPPPPFGSGCDVMLSRPIVANPPGTPIEAPAAMRPDSPAAPRPPAAQSLRGRIEGLLKSWEQQRSADLRTADDQSVVPEIRAAAERAAAIGGLYIEELDEMYHEYLEAIRA